MKENSRSTNKKPLPTIYEERQLSLTRNSFPGQKTASHLRKQPISRDRNRAYKIQDLDDHPVLTHPKYPALNLDNLIIPTRHPLPSTLDISKTSQPSLINSVPFPSTPRHKHLHPQKSILQNPINPNRSQELKQTPHKEYNPHSTIIWAPKAPHQQSPPSPKGRTWPRPHHLLENDARRNNSSLNANLSFMREPTILQRMPGRSHTSYPT